MKKIIVVCFILSLCSCAHVTVYDADGKPVKSVGGYGAFRDITHTTIKHPDGTTEETISTRSTTSDVMRATNEILGTVTATGAKLMP